LRLLSHNSNFFLAIASLHLRIVLVKSQNCELQTVTKAELRRINSQLLEKNRIASYKVS